MTDYLVHLRPRKQANSDKSSGEVKLSDLLCPVLLPAALFISSSDLRVLSNSLALSAWIVYLLDYRNSGSSGRGFPWLAFLPAWLCLATAPQLAQSRFRLYLTFWTVLIYKPLFNKLITKFSKSFTFGEGSIIIQGILLTTYSSIIGLSGLESYRTFQLAKKVAEWLKWFQGHCTSQIAITLLISWVVLSCLSVMVVILYKYMNWKVTTTSRKIFHLSVILVYIPGLMYDPVLLSYSSIGATLVFIFLELIRWSEKVPILSDGLSNYLKHFTDEKEGGSLILTNIYLLVGVSLPLWLWSGPLEIPSKLPLYAGIIAVGIGDAASSLIGSKFGQIKLFGTGKTLEGMAAGFICMLVASIMLDTQLKTEPLDFQDPRLLMLSTACLLTSAVELLVDQVDNLILPLVMYSAFTFIDQQSYLAYLGF